MPLPFNVIPLNTTMMWWEIWQTKLRWQSTEPDMLAACILDLQCQVLGWHLDHGKQPVIPVATSGQNLEVLSTLPRCNLCLDVKSVSYLYSLRNNTHCFKCRIIKNQIGRQVQAGKPAQTQLCFNLTWRYKNYFFSCPLCWWCQADLLTAHLSPEKFHLTVLPLSTELKLCFQGTMSATMRQTAMHSYLALAHCN